jgi:hypothetical protein
MAMFPVDGNAEKIPSPDVVVSPASIFAAMAVQFDTPNWRAMISSALLPVTVTPRSTHGVRHGLGIATVAHV